MKGAKKNYSPLSEINVTPLVDVMLVLLIIFMVTAPMMQQGLEVDLPKAKGKGFSEQSRVIVSITKKKNIYIDNRGRVNLKALSSRLKSEAGKEVLIKADSSIPYGFVMQVMAEIKGAGVEKVGMVTNPGK